MALGSSDETDWHSHGWWRHAGAERGDSLEERFESRPIQGQPVAQLPGMRVLEIERGSPLYRRIQGLIVTAVERNSAAWQAGFRPADIIYAVNRRRVRTFAEFQTALRGSNGGVSVSLLRGDSSLTIIVR